MLGHWPTYTNLHSSSPKGTRLDSPTCNGVRDFEQCSSTSGTPRSVPGNRGAMLPMLSGFVSGASGAGSSRFAGKSPKLAAMSRCPSAARQASSPKAKAAGSGSGSVWSPLSRIVRSLGIGAGLGDYAAPTAPGGAWLWEVEIGHGRWIHLDADSCRRLSTAVAQGKASEQREAGGFTYIIDLRSYVELNQTTGRRRAIRCSVGALGAPSAAEEGAAGGEEDEDVCDDGILGSEYIKRLRAIAEHLFHEGRELTQLLWRQGLGPRGDGALATFRALPEQQQVRAALGGFGTLALIIIVCVLLAGRSAAPGVGPAPPPAQPAQPKALPSKPGTWRVCQGPGDCSGDDILKQWSKSPLRLSGEVPAGFSSPPPGVAEEAWTTVAERWRQAPPTFRGSPLPLDAVANFVRDLLASDPFHSGDDVPFVDFRPPGEGKAVLVTQRQLAFLVANAIMGNHLAGGHHDGLSSALSRCGKLGNTGYLFSLLSFLAVLSRELPQGEQGSSLVAATPMSVDDGGWRQRLDLSLVEPTLCRRSAAADASESDAFDCGLEDFMAGGTEGQALVDIAGGVIGGGAQLCDVAASQDESLVQFYSEVLALAFFTASSNPDDAASGMLPSPFTVLGARRYMNDLTGESMGGSCGRIPEANWLNDAIPSATVSAVVADRSETIAAAAFVGLASVCSGCRADAEADPEKKCKHEDLLNNACDAQRRHLDEDIGIWHQAFEPSLYNPAVIGAFGTVVRRIGTGPWGAGVWYGDSQQYFLTTWLATSVLGGGVALDYYMYDAFCENQGNQCFVLGSGAGCQACIAKGALPGIGIEQSKCGPRGIQDVVAQFRGRPAKELYAALQGVPPPPGQIFDLIEGQ